MHVRVIKPAPQGIYLAPHDCVLAVDENGAVTLDYIAEAEPVEDGTVEIVRNGEKVSEQKAYRDPTDDELKARHKDALLIQKMDAQGRCTEVHRAKDFVERHQFSGWVPTPAVEE